MKKDSEIQKDVMDELMWEPLLNASEIGVAVKDGIVTLSGEVNSYSKKLVAERAAKKISGVKAIAEDIQVGVSPAFNKTDTEIAESILQSFRLDSTVPVDLVKVKVEDGIVTLEGEVDWDYERSAAWRCVENIPSVRIAYNLISLKPKAIASNIEEKISAAFQRHATLDANRISVAISGNKAVLEGYVRSLIEKKDAESIAWSAPGILNVENRIAVHADIQD